MNLTKAEIANQNERLIPTHQQDYTYLADKLEAKGVAVDDIVKKVAALQIAIPSWALGAGGTRFGRFPGEGEPRSLEEKLEDVGLLHALNRSSGAISLHIPWDIPSDLTGIQALAASLDLTFDAVNSNTFQDQPKNTQSYKFGSLCHQDPSVREQAIIHNHAVIDLGIALRSNALTVWLADGSNFPGQQDFRNAFEHTFDSLNAIYQYMPEGWKMLVEYKPYEPNFYSTVIPDWGTSHLLASRLGAQAYSLVDLGHHLPNTNIEQIVALLMMQKKLGGFHFNDSKYGDDDLTVGAVKPYQLFLIFHELVKGMARDEEATISWMIDASHNVKDPLEDLLQSVEAIKIAFAQALLIDQKSLESAQEMNDATQAQEILQQAFRTDVRPLLRQARLLEGGALSPLEAYRNLGIRSQLVKARGKHTMASGL